MPVQLNIICSSCLAIVHMLLVVFKDEPLLAHHNILHILIDEMRGVERKYPLNWLRVWTLWRLRSTRPLSGILWTGPVPSLYSSMITGFSLVIWASWPSAVHPSALDKIQDPLVLPPLEGFFIRALKADLELVMFANWAQIFKPIWKICICIFDIQTFHNIINRKYYSEQQRD